MKGRKDGFNKEIKLEKFFEDTKSGQQPIQNIPNFEGENFIFMLTFRTTCL